MASVDIELVQKSGSGSTEQHDDKDIQQESEEPKEADSCLKERSKTFVRSQSRLQRAQARWKTLQQHVAERGEARRQTTERWHDVVRLSRTVSIGVAEFFGVTDEPSDEREKLVEKWKERSRRMHRSSMFLGGHKAPVDYSDVSTMGSSTMSDVIFEAMSSSRDHDDVDGRRQTRRTAQPVDPLARRHRQFTPSRLESHASVSGSVRQKSLRRRDSVLRMAYDGIRGTLGAQERPAPSMSASLKSRSFSPAVKLSARLQREHPGVDPLFDSLFFDVAQPTSARAVPRSSVTPCSGNLGQLSSVAENALAAGGAEITKPSTPDYIRQPPQTPSTPGFDEVEGNAFASQRRIHIDNEIIEIVLEQGKREIGMGLVGKLTDRRYRQSRIEKMQSEMDDIELHRPFFTYWVTTVQVICFIFVTLVYGTAEIGFVEHEVKGQAQMPSLALEEVRHLEYANMWIGPKQADLIHLGAKYSPCMRVDENVMREIRQDRDIERETACCIRNDGSGCVQTTRSKCPPLIARWHNVSAGISTRAGSVCGYDFRYCHNVDALYAQTDDITLWPICEVDKTKTANATLPLHMKCEITARPCCAGILGECLMTSPEHCTFLGGYFHPEAQLCSQVSCLEEICGMLPFYKDSPNQFYRLWTSLFIHAGLIPLVITLVFQMFVMRDVEKLAGWLRIGIIYLISGIAGNLSSAIFLPYNPEAGPTGSQFGILACLFVEVIQSWSILSEPGHALAKMSAVLFVLLMLGLLPWIDNYAHVTGFIFGFLLSFPLLPHIAYLNRVKRLVIVLVCLTIAAVALVLLFVHFYVRPVTECAGCEYFNCLPFTANFCQSMRVNISRERRY